MILTSHLKLLNMELLKDIIFFPQSCYVFSLHLKFLLALERFISFNNTFTCLMHWLLK